jgi:hypothetical protein
MVLQADWYARNLAYDPLRVRVVVPVTVLRPPVEEKRVLKLS